MPWRRLVGCAALAVALLTTTSTTVPPSHAAEVPVVVIDGRGWGHGVGMAQDGIYWMGRAGAKTPQILAAFYPGTTLGKSTGTVRVVVLAVPARPITLSFPNGGRIESEGASGFPLRAAAGESVRIGHEGGRYWAEPVRGGNPNTTDERSAGRYPGDDRSTTTTESSTTTSSSSTTTSITMVEPGGAAGTSSGPPSSAPATTRPPGSGSTSTTAPPSGERVWSERPVRARPDGAGTVAVTERNRRYRGFVEVRLDEAGLLRAVNHLDVETYLKGMGEVRDSRWPPAALRAQAIAARTYALRALAAGGELCDDQRCQVYLGAHAEYGAMNKAVADTAGQVVQHKGKLASTVYSANAGGHSASREEGFGTTGDGYPYLRPAAYTTKDQMPWSVKVALTEVAARLGYRGRIDNIGIARAGPSGRALEVAIDGSVGRVLVPGRTFDARLGLKSTLFTLRVDRAAVAPGALPPAEGDVELQALPEEAVALPPRPPDPPLPSQLAKVIPPRDDLPQVAPATQPVAAYGAGSTNTGLALFVIVALAGVSAAVSLTRRRKPSFLP